MRNMHDMQRDGVDEPHNDEMQRKKHATDLGASEKLLAAQKHPLARNRLGNNPQMQLHQPAPNQTHEAKSETEKKDHKPRPNPPLPNPPIGIGIPDLGTQMQKGHTS